MEQPEEFRKIEDFERYSISNLGRVMNSGTGRFLKQQLTTTGYLAVGLCYRPCAIKFVKVHRLVAKAFVPRREGANQVNHLNGIRTDNRTLNLEWATGSQNMRHAVAVGLVQHKRDERGWFIADPNRKPTVRDRYPHKRAA